MVQVILLSQPTCMSCKVLESRFKTLQKDYPDFAYKKVNILEDHSYDSLGIMGTPHVIITKNDTEVFNNHVESPATCLNYIKGLLDES